MSEFAGYEKSDPMTRRIEVGLLMAGLATFTLLYNTQAILPYFTHDYSITPAAAAFSVSAATGGLAIGLLVAVPISERIGRVRLIKGSLALAALLGLGLAFVHAWPVFLLSRFLMGFVLAGLPATAAVYLKEEIHRSYAATATAIYIFGTTLGGLTGRLVSAGLIELAERLTFFDAWGLTPAQIALVGTALVACGCAVGCWLLLPNSRGFVPAHDSPWGLVKKFARVFTDPVLVGLLCVAGLGMGTFVGVFNVLGFRLEAAPYFLSVGLVGLLYLVYPLAGYAGTIAGRLADRTSMRTVSPYGPLIALVGIGLMATSPLPVIVLGLAIFATGFFVTHSLATSWVATRATSSVGAAAQATSLYSLFYYAGSSINGNIAPLAWSHFGWAGVTWLSLGLMGTCFVIVVALGWTKPAPGAMIR